MIQILGETQLLAQVVNSSGGHNGTLGVLASSHKPVMPSGSDSWQAAVLVYNSEDNSTSTITDDVTVSLKGLPAQNGNTVKGFGVFLFICDDFCKSVWFILLLFAICLLSRSNVCHILLGQ